MGRTKEYGEKVRAETREKIMATAVALFAEKGVAGTSAREIAEHAGIAVGLMYHYFKSKDEVYEALVQEAVKELDGIKNMTASELHDELEKEFAGGLEFAHWISILPNDYFAQIVDAFTQTMPRKQAEELVANIIGRCKLQLILHGGGK